MALSGDAVGRGVEGFGGGGGLQALERKWAEWGWWSPRSGVLWKPLWRFKLQRETLIKHKKSGTLGIWPEQIYHCEELKSGKVIAL